MDCERENHEIVQSKKVRGLLDNKMKIIRSTDFKTTHWSGGTTTELFIYPPDSEYSKRNFTFRLSRATIEVEHSDFTPLPGVRRKLMLLEGELELIHKDHYRKKLLPLEFDVFPGDWETQSIGKATDFNLMLRESAEGTFKVIKSQEKRSFEFGVDRDFIVFYALKEGILIEDIRLNQGDLLVLNESEKEEISVELDQGAVVIVTEVDL